MEKIIIKTLDKKGAMLIVGYTIKGVSAMPVAEATMNDKWQEQEILFLQKDVGIEGIVQATIVMKPNANNPSKPYWNITKINMDDEYQLGVGAPVEKVKDVKPEEQQINARNNNLMSAIDSSIVAQVCLKGAVEISKSKDFKNNEELGEFLCMAVNELAGAYKVALKALE